MKIDIRKIKKGDRVRIRAVGFGFSAFGWRVVTGKPTSMKGVYIRANGTSEFLVNKGEITGWEPKEPDKAWLKKKALDIVAEAYTAIDKLRMHLETMDMHDSDGDIELKASTPDMSDILSNLDTIEDDIKRM